MSEKSLADLFSTDSRTTPSIDQNGVQLFDHVSTKTVTHDTHGDIPRVSTGKDESIMFDMQQGDDAHIFKIDEDTMLVRFE